MITYSDRIRRRASYALRELRRTKRTVQHDIGSPAFD